MRKFTLFFLFSVGICCYCFSQQSNDSSTNKNLTVKRLEKKHPEKKTAVKIEKERKIVQSRESNSKGVLINTQEAVTRKKPVELNK